MKKPRHRARTKRPPRHAEAVPPPAHSHRKLAEAAGLGHLSEEEARDWITGIMKEAVEEDYRAQGEWVMEVPPEVIQNLVHTGKIKELFRQLKEKLEKNVVFEGRPPDGLDERRNVLAATAWRMLGEHVEAGDTEAATFVVRELLLEGAAPTLRPN